VKIGGYRFAGVTPPGRRKVIECSHAPPCADACGTSRIPVSSSYCMNAWSLTAVGDFWGEAYTRRFDEEQRIPSRSGASYVHRDTWHPRKAALDRRIAKIRI
ncbi:unnamed protein product, partial [Ectocarpus sp. 12 AP-2014]